MLRFRLWFAAPRGCFPCCSFWYDAETLANPIRSKSEKRWTSIPWGSSCSVDASAASYFSSHFGTSKSQLGNALEEWSWKDCIWKAFASWRILTGVPRGPVRSMSWHVSPRKQSFELVHDRLARVMSLPSVHQFYLTLVWQDSGLSRKDAISEKAIETWLSPTPTLGHMFFF